MTDLALERWPVGRLIPYARNARTHSDGQVAQIAGSLAEFGFNNPCLVDEQGVLIAGHGRVLAARRLGLETVPVIVLAHFRCCFFAHRSLPGPARPWPGSFQRHRSGRRQSPGLKQAVEWRGMTRDRSRKASCRLSTSGKALLKAVAKRCIRWVAYAAR
ncbi:hypothetical protein WCLP8_3340002 [uncultured Gammaproteobacteria bacterium]